VAKRDKTFLVGAAGVVAVLDFYSYVMRLDSSTLLIWNQRNGSPHEKSFELLALFDRGLRLID
jgi:hypothetical protein